MIYFWIQPKAQTSSFGTIRPRTSKTEFIVDDQGHLLKGDNIQVSYWTWGQFSFGLMLHHKTVLFFYICHFYCPSHPASRYSETRLFIWPKPTSVQTRSCKMAQGAILKIVLVQYHKATCWTTQCMLLNYSSGWFFSELCVCDADKPSLQASPKSNNGLQGNNHIVPPFRNCAHQSCGSCWCQGV